MKNSATAIDSFATSPNTQPVEGMGRIKFSDRGSEIGSKDVTAKDISTRSETKTTLTTTEWTNCVTHRDVGPNDSVILGYN